MAESDRLKPGLDDAGLDRRPSIVETHHRARDAGSRAQDLVDPILVVEGGHQQKQPRRIGQIGYAVGERTLKPIG